MAHLIGLLILLIPCVVTDIRSRRIPLWYLLGFSVAGVPVNLFLLNVTLPEIGLGLLPGLIFILLSRLTKGAIGMGDAILITAMGIFAGWSETLTLLLAACILSSLTAAVLLIFFKKKMKDSIPFAPFLGIACAAELVLSLVL